MTASNGRGIDLSAHWIDLRRIAYARFSRSMDEHGIDFEDLVQEAATKVHVANISKNPYDPAKVTLGTYLYMVIESALRHMIRARRVAIRRLDLEQIGIHDVDGTVVDAALVAADEAAEGGDETHSLLCSDIAAVAALDATERDCLALLSEGWTTTEIASVLEPEGVSRSKLFRLRRRIRDAMLQAA